MNRSDDYITCPNCKATNHPTSEVCWQCGQPLSGAERDQAPPQDTYRMQPLPDAPQPTADNTQLLAVLGFLFAVLGLLCCPFFAFIGVYLGLVLRGRGSMLGNWVIGTSLLFFAISTTLIIFAVLEMRRDPEFFESLMDPAL